MHVNAKLRFQGYIQFLGGQPFEFLLANLGQTSRGGGGLPALAVACQRFGPGGGRGGHQEGDAKGER